MKTPYILLAIVCATLYRCTAAAFPGLANISPLMALAICGAAFATSRVYWLIPIASIVLSDTWLAFQYGYSMAFNEVVLRFLCIGLALSIGRFIQNDLTAPKLVAASLINSTLFYLVTNTGSWASDPYYSHDFMGWIQALTIGHPEFPSTIMFFKNTLIGDQIFTLGIAFMALKWKENVIIYEQTS